MMILVLVLVLPSRCCRNTPSQYNHIITPPLPLDLPSQYYHINTLSQLPLNPLLLNTYHNNPLPITLSLPLTPLPLNTRHQRHMDSCIPPNLVPLPLPRTQQVPRAEPGGHVHTRIQTHRIRTRARARARARARGSTTVRKIVRKRIVARVRTRAGVRTRARAVFRGELSVDPGVAASVDQGRPRDLRPLPRRRCAYAR